jgi:aminoglycoside phosphotransferase (APT) family kinase protein
MPEELAQILNARWLEEDVDSLRDALYRRAFTRDFSDSSSCDEYISESDLAQLLSSANRSRNRWESGWRVERVEKTGTIVAERGALRRTASPGNYALTFTEDLPPQPGMAATLYFARESLTLQAGVYYAFGEAIPTQDDDVRPVRIYFSAPEDVLPELYSLLTGQLNRLEIPFTLKTLLARLDRDRSDATVLYISRRLWNEAEVLVKELSSSLLARLRPRTPLFTFKLAPGIGVAESPFGGESFGMHRCRLLAESILEARRSGHEDAMSRLQALTRNFRAAGIDLAQPHMQSIHDNAPPVEPSRVALSSANIVDWLRARGLLSNEAAVSKWQVRSHASRNYNFAVAREDGSGFFVKQLRVQGAESFRMMAREAAFYDLLTDPKESLCGLCPAFYGFDRDEQVLITELLPVAAASSSAQPPVFSVAFASAAGNTLAQLHRRSIDDLAGTSLAEHCDCQPPGIYTAHRGGPLLQWLGSGQLEIIDRVRNSPQLAPALDRMTADWTCARLIHGDVKWENCIWTTAAANTATLKWVDWELTDFGDPNWDAGCFVQTYLSHWVQSFPFDPAWGLEERLRRDEARFSSLQPALRAFLKEYLAVLDIPEANAPAHIERIMKCAAARMLQTSLEVMHRKTEPTPEALCLLNTSAEIMAHSGESLF